MVRRREKGYTLIVCVMAVTLLSIAVATALPLLSSQIKRDKEAELVFRGLQYAEAIRVFQRRFGRPPATLQELLDTRPRSIRRLWKDPMTEEGTWVVLISGPEGGAGGGNPDPNRVGSVEPNEGNEPSEVQPGAPNPVGPIIGVRSRSDQAGLRTFFDSESYASWRFTADLLAIRAPGADGLPVVPRAAWIGKAFRKGLQAGGAPANPAAPPNAEPQNPRRPLLGGEPPEPQPQPPPQR